MQTTSYLICFSIGCPKTGLRKVENYVLPAPRRQRYLEHKHSENQERNHFLLLSENC